MDEVISGLREAGGILVFLTLVVCTTYLVGVIERFGRRPKHTDVPTHVEDRTVNEEGLTTVVNPRKDAAHE